VLDFVGNDHSAEKMIHGVATARTGQRQNRADRDAFGRLDVDALLAPRWSGYGGAPAVFSGVFVRQLMTHTGHRPEQRSRNGKYGILG
jgi:hypothetical protein